MPVDIETVVIGGGVIGLAAAGALSTRGGDVLLMERHARLGSETSARNSEVVHAGLYYPHGSLKARLCVSGQAKLKSLCDRSGVALKRLGKLVVATTPAEISSLERLAATARSNGVTDVELLSSAAAQAIEPQLACTAALHSPSTSVVDGHGFLLALETVLRDAGGTIARATEVTAIGVIAHGGFRLAFSSAAADGAITCRRLVIAAGHDASRLGTMLAPHLATPPPETRFAKGHYYVLRGPTPFARLVYPLPGNAGLGIHYTLSTSGEAKFGPDVAWCDTPSLDFDDANGTRKAAFVTAVRHYWPDITPDRLSRGFVGVRPKLHGPSEPPADFAIQGPETHGLEGLVALYGIESPGLTASLAIGDFVAALIERKAASA